ncbi:MAG: hypothetical protein ACHP7O_04140 [Burkholderiales bacterium]
MTATPGLNSGVAVILAGFTAADFTAVCDSDFLVVTGAFDCADTGFSDTFAKDLAVGLTVGDAALPPAFSPFTGCVRGFLATAFATASFAIAFVFFLSAACGTATPPLREGLEAAAALGAGLTFDLDAVGFALFAGSAGDFAGFFIAFAM